MGESKVKDENFFLVSGWMLNRLNLKGVALQVFSIIYGFSQDGEGSFTGSLQYLMDFTNASKNTVLKALKDLTDLEYITKSENTINGVRFCTYKTNAPVVQKLHWGSSETEPGGGAEIAPGGSSETEPNNISNINKDNISKDIVNEITELFHSVCVSFPSIRSVSPARRKAVMGLLKTYTVEDFKTVFTNTEASSFLKGADGGWKASFDWLIKENNFLKVLEGNYADKSKRGRKEPVPGWCSHSLGEAEEEAIRKQMNKEIDMEELERLEAEQEKELAARAERLKRILGQEAI